MELNPLRATTSPRLGGIAAFRRDPLAFCERVAREAGDYAFFRLGPVRCVLVNDPAGIQQLLTKEASHLHKSWDFALLRFVLGRGLVTSEDELWRRERRLIQPAFHNERIRAYAATMVERVEHMLDRWRDGQEVDLVSEMSQLTLEIVGRALFGTNMERDAEIMAAAMQVVMDRFEAIMTSWLPLPIPWPVPANFRAYGAIRRIDHVVHRIVSERRRSATRGDDLLSWLLEASDEQGKLDDGQLRDELVTLLLAGHETTSLALAWTLALLHEHPEVDAALAAHIRDTLGDRSPRPEDATRLGYVRQVVEEGMRIRPPVWGIGREAQQDIELLGHTIPKRTQIFLIQWVTQRDPRFFPEPERFDPDRWSDARRESIPRYAYFPFGGGPRVCIGLQFAMLELTLLLAAIVRRFRVEILPSPALVLQPAVTLRPKHGMRARLHARA